MIPVIINPERGEWPALTRRETANDEALAARVATIIERVRQEGDRALLQLAEEIDGWKNPRLQVPEADIRDAAEKIAPDLQEAIATAARNIRRFHEAQRTPEVNVEILPGVRCIQRSIPIQHVGLYIPGGTAPLFSTVLMLAIPAQVAGCKSITLCTPPSKTGTIAPEILYTAARCGINQIFAVGGAQAIAAMACGTETIPRADKIFGPGNRYVTRAKQMLATSQVAIDMPAGPSEIMILADNSANPAFVAADILSQAEHGGDSQALAVVDSPELAHNINQHLSRQLDNLPRKTFAVQALNNSRIILFHQTGTAVDFANAYAAEHLIIARTDAWQIAEQITAAGSIFIGNYSPESAGDYASGTNHTLPTSGWAKAYSGVNTDSFAKKITYQELTPQGLTRLGGAIIAMAEAEGLEAHAQAVKIRLNTLLS